MGRTAEDEAKKLVLGTLLNNADAPSKKVLSSYSFSVPYKTNVDKMKAHSAVLLEACATYLGFTVREGDRKLYKNQKVLCDRLILKIESLFDIECTECKITYRNELKDTPLLRCRLCLQGSHNCSGMVSKVEALNDLQSKNLIPPGTTWLCHECLKKNDLSLQPSQKIAKEKLGPTEDNPAHLHRIDEEEDEENEEDRESPRRGRDKTEATKTNKSSKICKNYIQRKCPHGLTGKRLINDQQCPDQHPRRCRFYSRFGNDKDRGCRKGKDCTFFHPKLCRDSVALRRCLNKECTYHHLKGTARKGFPITNDVPPAPADQRKERHQGEFFNVQMDNKNWPPLRKAESSLGLDKMGSLHSIYTPYPPTVDNSRQPRGRKESTSEKDKAFLEKLMENLKNGIISQMDAKMTQLQNQIPVLVQEAHWTQQQIQRARMESSQSMGPPLMSLSQIPQATQVNAPIQTMQMPMNFMPNFQGSCL